MSQLQELIDFLSDSTADFEVIQHSKPILKTEDAGEYFDISKAAPVFIVNTDNGFYSLIVSGKRDKIDIKKLGNQLGFKKIGFADKNDVLQQTGYEIGSIPLIGHNLPCYIDERILRLDYIYGGTGNPYFTLKIKVQDFISLNKIVSVIDIP